MTRTWSGSSGTYSYSAIYRTQGLGKRDPLAPNTTPANLARNRRVEFRVASRLSVTA